MKSEEGHQTALRASRGLSDKKLKFVKGKMFGYLYDSRASPARSKIFG
jgi:hypothetical protein